MYVVIMVRIGNFAKLYANILHIYTRKSIYILSNIIGLKIREKSIQCNCFSCLHIANDKQKKWTNISFVLWKWVLHDPDRFWQKFNYYYRMKNIGWIICKYWWSCTMSFGKQRKLWYQTPDTCNYI